MCLAPAAPPNMAVQNRAINPDRVADWKGPNKLGVTRVPRGPSFMDCPLQASVGTVHRGQSPDSVTRGSGTKVDAALNPVALALLVDGQLESTLCALDEVYALSVPGSRIRENSALPPLSESAVGGSRARSNVRHGSPLAQRGEPGQLELALWLATTFTWWEPSPGSDCRSALQQSASETRRSMA